MIWYFVAKIFHFPCEDINLVTSISEYSPSVKKRGLKKVAVQPKVFCSLFTLVPYHGG